MILISTAQAFFLLYKKYNSAECSVLKSMSSNTYHLTILYRILLSDSYSYFYVHTTENCRCTCIKYCLSICNLHSFGFRKHDKEAETQSHFLGFSLPSFVSFNTTTYQLQSS